MANTYFKFKQFIVHQDKAAMKVGTDGVLLGAWADVSNSKNILDVGTGTGLIALMLAQRNKDAMISAIDIDEGAVKQAELNFEIAEWTERLSISHSSLQLFNETNVGSFDHIVCNPPFFKQSFKSTYEARNMARHTDSLSYEELIDNAFQLSNGTGKLSVVLPFAAKEEFIDYATSIGYYLSKLTQVRPTPQKSFVRILIELSKKKVEMFDVSDLVIEDKGRHGYSGDYIALTQAFYLAM